VSTLALVLNLVLAYGIKYMWNMSSMLQFIIFMAAWRISLDPYAQKIIAQFKKLALFEFIDTQPFKDAIKDFLFSSTLQEVSEGRRSLSEQ